MSSDDTLEALISDDEVENLRRFFQNLDEDFDAANAGGLAAKLLGWSQNHGEEEYSKSLELISTYFAHHRDAIEKQLNDLPETQE